MFLKKCSCFRFRGLPGSAVILISRVNQGFGKWTMIVPGEKPRNNDRLDKVVTFVNSGVLSHCKPVIRGVVYGCNLSKTR